MKISAKAEYAVRAALELAGAHESGAPVKAEKISRAQEIPAKFLESILLDLRRADLVRSQRGAVGGYWLA
ncbi:MAG: Rrf2 family transcriptional regulator, partial [Thermoleophilia bacterium]|nr:Rrf2 family transcriptional regulator [Thermoleophilia bacterium]